MRLATLFVCGATGALISFGTGLSVPRVNLMMMTQAVLFLEPNVPGAAIMPDEIAVSALDEFGKPIEILVSKYEVTFSEWQMCVDSGVCSHVPQRRKYANDDHPVSGVSWHDAQQFIAWISHETGLQYRLPLESEWRVLAGDVLENKVDKLFDDPRMAWAADYANFGKRADRRTKPIGSFGLEANGVADLAGNVWEWTASCWRSPTAPSIGETSDNCGGVRMLAGTHITYQSELIRVVPTGGCSIGFPPANIGFRLVRDIVDSKQGPSGTFSPAQSNVQAS